jgi:hypothetical protein
MATAAGRGFARRLATETKQAFKTTEFWVFVVVAVAILIAGAAVDIGDDGEGTTFPADQVWLYVTLLTIGYLLSRGLAKSGSRDPYTDHPASDSQEAPLADRVKAAASALQGEGSQGRADGPPAGGYEPSHRA